MKGKRYWEIGGFVAGGVLILFGVVAIFLGVNRVQHDPRRDQGRGDHVRHRRRPRGREVREPTGPVSR